VKWYYLLVFVSNKFTPGGYLVGMWVNVIPFTLVGDFYEARRKREVVHSQSEPKHPVCSLFLGAGRLSPGRILSPGGPSCSTQVRTVQPRVIEGIRALAAEPA
jgi:hypothetical protein